MGTAAVAYIALLASRLPWFWAGAAPAAAGAGYSCIYSLLVHDIVLSINNVEQISL